MNFQLKKSLITSFTPTQVPATCEQNLDHVDWGIEWESESLGQLKTNNGYFCEGHLKSFEHMLLIQATENSILSLNIIYEQNLGHVEC